MEDSSFSPEQPPGYSEHHQEPYFAQSSPFSPFLRSVNQTRNSNIRNLVSTHVHPHLYESALSGLSKTTLLFIPSNISSLHLHPLSPTSPPSTDRQGKPGTVDRFPGETIIGFPSAENLHLIRLHGAENTLEFWHQDAVIRDLDAQLKDEIRRSGHRVVGDLKKGDGTKSEAEREVLTRRDSFRSAQWMPTKVEAVGPGEVGVGVECREVSLRVENEMGLFETRSGKALVVRVEVGG